MLKKMVNSFEMVSKSKKNCWNNVELIAIVRLNVRPNVMVRLKCYA